MVEIVTGTVISGSAALRLSLARNSPHAFQPNDLDLYSPDECWPYVLEFLMSGTAFKFLRFQAHTYGLPAVREIAWLSSHVDNPLTLNIMRSRGSHPVEPILQFHSSSVVGAVDANGVWFGNPRLLTEGRAIMNRLHFRLDTIGARTRALTVLQKYAARGFKFSLDYINRHTCGRNRNCPTTICTTVDGGCLVVRFPRPAFGAMQAPERVYPFPYALSWSYGSVGCLNGIRYRRDNLWVIPVYDPELNLWRFYAKILLDYVSATTED
ncbi:hypothetical protein B0H13DRAFT_1903413 [Mycena leptocephala]|nr:hypothetical protein B0H13DRAFT_1903413 [Mycena leptocephala]